MSTTSVKTCKTGRESTDAYITVKSGQYSSTKNLLIADISSDYV